MPKDFPTRLTVKPRIEPIEKIPRSLRRHPELILNYFRAQKKMITSEGPGGLQQQGQNHAEKILWLSHHRVLELSLDHSLGELPEPECTHDFF